MVRISVSRMGIIHHFVDGKLHREDGPAITHVNGSKWWYANDELHRADGPAIEHADGSKWWYVNDLRHRKLGPAIEYYDGVAWTMYWFIDDKELTEERHGRIPLNG